MKDFHVRRGPTGSSFLSFSPLPGAAGILARTLAPVMTAAAPPAAAVVVAAAAAAVVPL